MSQSYGSSPVLKKTEAEPPKIQPSPSVLRKAIPEDYEDILRMSLQFHAENATFPISPKKLQRFIERAIWPDAFEDIEGDLRGVIAVIGPPGKLEAMTFVTVSEWWYTDQSFIEELLVYVDPDFRKSNHAKAIIDFLKERSDAMGLPLMIGMISNARTEAKLRLYRRKFPKIGEFFMKMPERLGAT